MEIKQVHDTKEFDVFFGRGWNNWVRVLYTPNAVEVVKATIQPSQQTLDQVYWKIKKKFFSPTKGK
jgi:hypothetical protein